ncbi:MAG TPA: hypothetical protein VNZ53_27525 [Steroidobacteraceae bacterium]|nr:hypothetical protein [Steroidobacteraceae bacterium]
MRTVYPAAKGSKPMRIGMNLAKRVARRADERDQVAVLRELGSGYPRQHSHHQELVRQRHAYYGDVYEQDQRDREARRIREAAPVTGNPSGGDPQAGDVDGAVPDAAAGTDSPERTPG